MAVAIQIQRKAVDVVLGSAVGMLSQHGLGGDGTGTPLGGFDLADQGDGL